ncbi:hypothetical protein TNIN_291541 [Trichonephila inaurata madagascariensis]|uniref:Uncharacterized protein n=1 Tax=Trichonephila inaurata madagascariensis TaxID=2747483 RepID=A0A8X7CPB6_9ARAC|nr:hypothetical protein TNIN_291541 [Trichonephila inaurata madagascariensis]
MCQTVQFSGKIYKPNPYHLIYCRSDAIFFPVGRLSVQDKKSNGVGRPCDSSCINFERRVNTGFHLVFRSESQVPLEMLTLSELRSPYPGVAFKTRKILKCNGQLQRKTWVGRFWNENVCAVAGLLEETLGLDLI